MTIMITGLSVAQDVPIGTVVGYLHCCNSGLTIPSNFVLGDAATGLFAIQTTPSGPALVTNHKLLPQGFYSVKVKALGISAAYVEGARFLVQVAPPKNHATL